MTRGAARPGTWCVLLLAPVLATGLTVAAQAISSEGFTSAPELGPPVHLGFLFWGIAPSTGMVGLVVGGLLARWRGRAALLVGGLAQLGLTAWSLASIVWSDSSTAGVGYVFLPLYAWVLVVLTGAVLLVLNLRRTPVGARP